MRHPKRLLYYNLTGYIVSLLYTFGISYSLVMTHLLQVAPLEILKYAAWMLLILTVLFFNRWTSLFTLIAAAVGTYWLIRYGGAVDWAFDNISPFIDAVIPFVQGKAPLPDVYHLPLALVFTGTVALFSRITASRLRGCTSLLVAAASVYIAEWFLGHHNIILLMALSGAAIASVFAYSYAREFVLQGMEYADNNDFPEEDTPGQTSADMFEYYAAKLPRASAIAAYAIPFALAAALLASTVTPVGAQFFRSVTVEKVVDDVVDLIGQNHGFSRKQYGFSISTYGYSNTGDLGGPVSVSGDTVMTVDGISPTLLKGSVKTYYTGKGWKNDEALGTYRYDSALWNAKRSDVFDLDRPVLDNPDDRYNMERSITLRITPYKNLYTLFSPTRPISLSGSDKNFIPYFNNIGELYPKHKINVRAAYSVTAYQIYDLNNRLTDFVVGLENTLPPEDEEKAAEIQRLYMQLPENLPASVRSVAQELASSAGSNSPFLRALAIRQYFLDNFTYTLKPSIVPKDRDFVEYFLETKEGYCSYYATAMVVLARAAGIPARYCEGFLLTNHEHQNYLYTVTGKDAHAWAELYFEGIGWIPFDSTPIGQPQTSRTPVNTTPVTPEIPTPSPSLSIENVIPAAPVQRPAWISPAIIVGGLILINLLLILMHRFRFRKKRLLRKYGKRGAIEIWWRAILDSLAYQDKLFRRRDGETAAKLASRIGNLVACPVCTMDQLVRIVMRAYYSDLEISDVEIDVVYRFYRAMERRIHKRMTPPVYAVKRVLFPGLSGFRGIPKKKK